MWLTNRCFLGNRDQLWLRAHLRLWRRTGRRILWRQRRICLRHQSASHADRVSTQARRLHCTTSTLYRCGETGVHAAYEYVYL